MSSNSSEDLKNNPEVRKLVDDAYMMGIRAGVEMAYEHLKFFKEVGLPKLEEEAKELAKKVKEGKVINKVGNA